MYVTENPAFDQAVEMVEMGQVPGMIPVMSSGRPGIWTTSLPLDISKVKDDTDALAVAIIAIRRAYHDASEAGAVPTV